MPIERVIEVKHGEVLISEDYIVQVYDYGHSESWSAKNITYRPYDSGGWGIMKQCSVYAVDAMTQDDFDAFAKDAHSRLLWEPNREDS